MGEKEGTRAIIPIQRSYRPSKHHTKKIQGVVEFATSFYPPDYWNNSLQQALHLLAYQRHQTDQSKNSFLFLRDTQCLPQGSHTGDIYFSSDTQS